MPSTGVCAPGSALRLAPCLRRTEGPGSGILPVSRSQDTHACLLKTAGGEGDTSSVHLRPTHAHTFWDVNVARILETYIAVSKWTLLVQRSRAHHLNLDLANVRLKGGLPAVRYPITHCSNPTERSCGAWVPHQSNHHDRHLEVCSRFRAAKVPISPLRWLHPEVARL